MNHNGVFYANLALKIELLHLLFAVANSNKGAGLGLLFRAPFPLHTLQLLLPATPHQIHTWRRAKKPMTRERLER